MIAGGLVTGPTALLAATGSWLDILIVVLVAVAAMTGWRRGFVLEFLSYGGLLAGLVLGAILAPGAAGLVGGDATARALTSILTLFGVALLFQTSGFLIGATVRRTMREGGMAHGFDSVGGGFFSGLAMVAGLWFLGVTLVAGPSPMLSRAINESIVLRTVDRVAPDPPSVMAALRKFLDTSGFPEVFSGLDPRFAPPVERPDPASVSPIALEASRSTVKILGEACASIQEGTGWVAAPGLVVTNAHVIAGVAEPRVLDEAGGNFAAVPVAYDPDRDLAVLWVDGFEAPALGLVDGLVERGTPGVVLGFPGNANSVVETPAAVRGDIRAVGRDIYYTRQVERSVYIVQAEIRPGNSGGPLVGMDGQVIGVIFAAAVGEPQTGYALTDAEVRPVLDDAAAGQLVGTGACRV